MVWTLSFAALLAGCSDPSPERPQSSQAQQDVPQIEPSPNWTIQASATAGAALVLSGADGREQLRIACRRSPADIYVAAHLQPVESEERLTLGFGETLFSLVRQPSAGSDSVVEATGPLTAELAEAVVNNQPIGISYGSKNLGPFQAPTPDVAQTFQQACRSAMGI